MTVLSAQTIRRRSYMIEPFSERALVNGLSYGLGPASYDVRCLKGAHLWPGQHALLVTMEKIIMPNDLMAKVANKSTWARKFINVDNTVIDPGFTGHVTLEVINHGPKFVVIDDGDPICQLIFTKLDEPTEMPYTGKYQNAGAAPQEAINEAGG